MEADIEISKNALGVANIRICTSAAKWEKAESTQEWNRICEILNEAEKEDETMDFTYQEIARLYKMVGIALTSGEIAFDEVSESVHMKITREIGNRMNQETPANYLRKILQEELRLQKQTGVNPLDL